MSLRSRLESRLQQLWYAHDRPAASCRFLSTVYKYISNRRQQRLKESSKHIDLPVPVIVIGNITVGGVGKTPVTDWLVTHLAANGWRPGIVSRGYGGRLTGPHSVTEDASPSAVGDEPCMLTARGHTVCVSKDRLAGVLHLANGPERCDVVVADDGLQHYALPRDMEIVVVDGHRRFGNGHLLPAGPLREPVERLNGVDHVICNGGEAQADEWPMSLVVNGCFNLRGERVELLDMASKCLAVAGIGHPARFFATCRDLSVEIDEHPHPDHHQYTTAEVNAWAGPVITTEKDAIKLRKLTDRADIYWLRVEANLPDALWQQIMPRLRALGRTGESRD